MSDYIGRKVRLIGSNWPDFRRDTVETICKLEGNAFRADDTLLLGWLSEDGEFVPRPEDVFDYRTELVEEERPTVNFSPSTIQKLAEALDKYVVVQADGDLQDVRATVSLPKVRVTVSIGETVRSVYLDLDGHSAKLAGQMAEKLVEMIYEGEL